MFACAKKETSYCGCKNASFNKGPKCLGLLKYARVDNAKEVIRRWAGRCMGKPSCPDINILVVDTCSKSFLASFVSSKNIFCCLNACSLSILAILYITEYG